MKKIDKLHAYSSIIQKILNLPESYDGYLQLTLLYVDQDRIKEAQKAVYLALISIEKNENIKTIVSCLRERYNPNKFEYFLKLIHDTSRSLSEPTEVEGCRLLIQAIDLFLTEITVYDRPNSLFLWWGYFKNILKQYIGGKHCLNSYSESFGDNLFSYRTMAESLLGAWDLSYNHHSGVDFSILQDNHKFSIDAQNYQYSQSYFNYQK